MEIGQKAPDFELRDQHGNNLRLSTLAPGRALVVFFYPKDGTPLCTIEACSFRDNQHLFDEYGAQLVGISSDLGSTHQAFAAKNGVNYPLLSDRDGRVRKLWNVPTTMGILPGRVTYVLDSDLVVQNIFSGQLRPEAHVSTALDAVKKLAAMKV